MSEAAVVEAYEKYSADLVRFAATVAGPNNAEDLVADVVLSCLRSPPSSTDSDLRSYLYTAIVNAARKDFRSRTRRMSREALASASPADPGDVLPSVTAALNALSPQQRSVIHLTYWEDLTPVSVSRRLGVSEGTVRRQLARARRRLREVLT